MTGAPIPPRFSDGDAFYAALVARLEAAEGPPGLAYLARLVLVLANEIGDQPTLMAALAAAEAKEPRDV